MNKENIESLKNMTAYEFLSTTTVDGQIFTTYVVMSFLKVHFGNEAFKKGIFMSEKQSKAIRKTDKALEELFEAFKDGYTDNVISNL